MKRKAWVRSRWFAAIFLSFTGLASPPSIAVPFCNSAEHWEAEYAERRVSRDHLAAGRYEPLEKRFGAVLAAHEAGRITDAEVATAFAAFEVSDARLEARLSEWVKAYPKSRAARLAQANYWTQRAWAARGTELSGKTSHIQFAAMQQAFRKAEKDLEAAEAMASKPTPEWALRIAILQHFSSRANEAGDLYRRALARHPDTISVRIAYAYASQPQWGGSFERIAAIARDVDGLAEAPLRYAAARIGRIAADAHYFHKDVETATELYERAARLCPAEAGAASQLVEIYSSRQDFPALIATTTRLLEVYPDNGWTLGRRGWAYLRTQRFNEAFADFTRASQLGNAQAFESLAWLHEWGRGGAKQDYRKAIELYEIAHNKGVAGARQKADNIRKATGLK